MVQSLVEGPQEVPPVARREVPAFLYFWNYFHQSLLGEDKMAGLNDLARRAGMDTAAKQLLKHRNIRKRLLAITTLGHLRDQSMWDEFVRLAKSKDPAVSLAAARALVQIHAERALNVLLPMIASRTDWSPAKVAGLLSEAGPLASAGRLAQAAASSPPDAAVRLIQYLCAIKGLPGLPIIRCLARQSDAPAVKAACVAFIAQCEDPQDLELLRQACRDASPIVRASAASGLGKMGAEGDEASLVALLGDSDWEVRHRAADALARLPSLSAEDLVRIHERCPPLAREMLAPFLERRPEEGKPGGFTSERSS